MPNHLFEPTANGYAGRVRLFGIDEAIVLVGIVLLGVIVVFLEQLAH